MVKKSTVLIISICLIIVAVVLGVVIYFIIASTLNRHSEKCITRYLYEKGRVRDVDFDEDPMAFSNNHCDFVMDIAKSRVRDSIKIPCKPLEDDDFMKELIDLGLESEIYARNGNVPQSKIIMTEVGRKISVKCNGLQPSY